MFWQKSTTIFNKFKQNKINIKEKLKMKEIKLTMQQQIQETARQLRCSKYAEYDASGERGSFYDLYNDIIQELKGGNSEQIVNFYNFVELMHESDVFFKPEDAFLAGQEAKAAGKEYNHGLTDYFRRVNNELNNAGLPVRKQELFQGLCDALGETRGLMTEFIEGYTKYTSVEIYYIEEFFKQGYLNASHAS